jgi:MFS family permease
MSATAYHGEKAQKGRTMSIYGMALASATLVGYGLSGIIASRLGYQALFLLGAVMLVLGALISISLPRASKQSRFPAEMSSGGGSNKVRDLLKKRGLVVAYCSIFAQYFSFGGVVTLLPLYIRSLGMETFHIGILLATFAIMFIIVQFPSGILSDKVRRLVPTATGLSLGIGSLVILPLIIDFRLLTIAMALYGVAYGMLFPSISALIADHTIPEERGLATGIFHALLTAGVAIGAPTIGWVGEVVGVPLGLALTPSIMILALITTLTALKRS